MNENNLSSLKAYLDRWEKDKYIKIDNPQEYWSEYWSERIFGDIADGIYPFWEEIDFIVELIRKLKLKKILCLGNGVSLEAAGLSYAGFDVDALDISKEAIEFLSNRHLTDKDIKRLFLKEQYKVGGKINYIIGDLTDKSVCPGLYDVIITRCVLQYYTRSNFLGLLDIMISKLNDKSLFISKTHNAYDVNRAIGEYFLGHNFVICKSENDLLTLAEGKKVAFLYGSSG